MKEIFKKVIGAIFVVALFTIIVSKTFSYKEPNVEKIEYLSGKHNVVMTIKGYGEVELELDADQAPITVTNFINLVNEGFYDGLTFHRSIKDFMIQGGDPLGNGMGGSSEKITGEFTANGINNTISHKRGTISMGRTPSSYDSASSQFFIVHKDSTYLDGNYAAFGHVTEGMDIIDQVIKDCEKVDKDSNGGILNDKDKPVIESIKVIE